MKCAMCKSPRTMKFVDAFGERRIFCKGCGRSFVEIQFMKILEQKNLQEFRVDSYYRVPMPR